MILPHPFQRFNCRGRMTALGPVIIGVHVDYRDNHLLFEMVKGDNIH